MLAPRQCRTGTSRKLWPLPSSGLPAGIMPGLTKRVLEYDPDNHFPSFQHGNMKSFSLLCSHGRGGHWGHLCRNGWKKEVTCHHCIDNASSEIQCHAERKVFKITALTNTSDTWQHLSFSLLCPHGRGGSDSGAETGGRRKLHAILPLPRPLLAPAAHRTNMPHFHIDFSTQETAWRPGKH